MIAVKNEEYRKLELDSSNLLIKWDAQWGLGWYEEATYAVLQAGDMRRRMGQMSLDAGEFCFAAEDWLSSAACFVSATAVEAANESLRLARELVQDGKIPAERKDLFAALREREEEVHALAVKANKWIEANSDLADLGTVATNDRLAALRQQVRELPGLPLLHYVIFKVACELGELDLATKHLDWASKFASDEQELLLIQCALGSELIARGMPEKALELANSLLNKYPGSVFARQFLAVALYHAGHPEEALTVLRPLLDRSLVAAETSRIFALTVSAQYLHQLGRQAEFAEFSKEIDLLEKAASDPWIKSVIATYHAAILGGANGTPAAGGVPSSPLSEPSRILLCQSARQLIHAA